jgi:hypothetical protein
MPCGCAALAQGAGKQDWTRGFAQAATAAMFVVTQVCRAAVCVVQSIMGVAATQVM